MLLMAPMILGCEWPTERPTEPPVAPPVIEPLPPVSKLPVDPLEGLSPEERAQRLRELGAAVYSADGPGRCEICHGIDGQGLRGAIPPLVADRPWARNCFALGAIVLFGANETLVRDGITYVGVMPPLAEQLDDLQVAAVSTFVNGQWGTSGACQPDDIRVLRMQGPMSLVE